MNQNSFAFAMIISGDILATLYIMYRTIQISAIFGYRSYTGKKRNYFLMCLAYSLIAGGALLSIGDWDISDSILTMGIALMLYASRRNR